MTSNTKEIFERYKYKVVKFIYKIVDKQTNQTEDKINHGLILGYHEEREMILVGITSGEKTFKSHLLDTANVFKGAPSNYPKGIIHFPARLLDLMYELN